MAKNKLCDLRDHLFETMEGLRDGTIDPERAKAMSGVAQTIINSAKVEVDMVKAVGASSPGSSFFGLPEETRELRQELRKQPVLREIS